MNKSPPIAYQWAMRIGVLKYRPFHDAILRPVADTLGQKHECLLTDSEAELCRFKPHVVVLGESMIIDRLRYRLPRTLFVHTRHGLASKNQTCAGASATDYMCVTSPSVKDWYLRHGAAPRRGFWVVGYLQMDPLFRKTPLPRPITIPSDRKVVLYAPTWNATLSSAPMLGPRVAELIRGGRSDVSVIIKPHPLIATHSPEWTNRWKSVAAQDPHVHLVEDADCDIIPYLQMADVLVTDASSVQLEFLATGRPMVLISNPDRLSSKDFDANGFEWTWRDMGEEIFDAESLPHAMAHAFNDPGRHAAKRSYYRQQLFGDLTDGRTLERLCEHVNALERLVPLVQAQWAIAWPFRKARGAARRLRRWAAGGDRPKAASVVQPALEPAVESTS